MASGVDAVLNVLERVGFERLPKPLVVAGTSFEFDAAARGTEVSHDLVVVAASEMAPRRLVQLLSGLARTLDRVASRRPVTLVLVGEAMGPSTTSALERHARVLRIESDDPEPEEVRRAVAVLMPLALPTAGRQGRDPLGEATEVLGPALTVEHELLLDAARVGPDAVRSTLRGFVEAAFSDQAGESEEP